MDSLNNSSWINETGSLLNFLNESAQQTKGVSTRTVYVQSVYFFVVVLLGLPGNLLVIAVYIRRTTTSTKVYLLALAVSDTSTCLCGIILTRVIISRTMLYVILCLIEVSITFSLYLLAFVSIERLLAVWRPHSFKLGATRAKIALSIIAVLSGAVGAVMTIARIRHHALLSRLFPMFVTLVAVVVMIICYSMVAAKLLMKARAARMNVGIQSAAQSSAPGPFTVSHSNVSNARNTGKVDTAHTTISAKDAKTYKGVMLLFIVTVVCTACWMPQWLAYVGLNVSTKLRRVFVLNSAVNPFIYGLTSSVFRNDVRQFYRKTVSVLTVSFR